MVADYQASAANIEGVLGRLTARGALPAAWDRAWADTPAEAIALVVDAVASAPGGARGWFLRHGASEQSVERYVERITAPAPGTGPAGLTPS